MGLDYITPKLAIIGLTILMALGIGLSFTPYFEYLLFCSPWFGYTSNRIRIYYVLQITNKRWMEKYRSLRSF